MIRTTTWTLPPEVCACVVSYTWDDESSEDDRVHTVSAFDFCGGDHAQASLGENLEDSEFFAYYLKAQGQ